jgi:CheY-like chemotaxis protein
MALDKSFLVVDDSATMRQLITMTLKKLGCTSITGAADGQSALQSLENNLPGIILTDLSMPGMDGLQLIQAVRQQHKDLPIIILSTFGDDATRDQAMTLGANEFVMKPLSAITLKAALERVFPEVEF